jgi:hypothetical protein
MFDIERYTGDAAQLTLLVSELATALRAWNPRSQLSFALSVFPDSQANFYDHLAISRLVDYIFVMACESLLLLVLYVKPHLFSSLLGITFISFDLVQMTSGRTSPSRTKPILLQ